MASAAAVGADAGVSSGSASMKLESNLTKDMFRKTDSMIKLQLRLSNAPAIRLCHTY